MRIRIDDIPPDGLELTFSGEEDILSDALATIPAPRGVTIRPEVRGYVRLFDQEDDILLTGVVQAKVTLQCSRCLADYDVDTEVELDFVLRRKAGKEETEEETASLESNEIVIQGPVFDPGEMIAQELLLELPMQPLCREDCPGLCPRCGALKGSPECTCPPESSRDPRWAALDRLKGKTRS